MLYIQKVGLILALLGVSAAFQWQFPFDLSSLRPNGAGGSSHLHFSTIDPNDFPIDLLKYHEDYVIRVTYGEDSELKKFLSSSSFESTNDTHIKFSRWGRNSASKQMDLQIDESNLIRLIEKFPSIKYEIIIEDLSQKVYETYPKDFQNSFTTKDSQYKYKSTEVVMEATKMDAFSEVFFKEYRPLETIDSWLELLQETYPDILTIEEIGKTSEQRPFKIIHFAVPNDDIEHGERRTIVITGGTHAREWISVSSTLYTIYDLLQFYSEEPNSKIFKELDFLFIPVGNPDGYEYTWNADRLWRKNRQQTVEPNCIGIDLDHSYDYHWTKSTDWACGEEYSGETPFEAIESRIWEEYLNNTNHDHKIWGYIDLHSYSQEVLYPYAYSCSQQPRDEENLIEAAYGIAKSIRLQSGINYHVLPACIDRDADLVPDLGSGSALDFMYHNRAYWAFQLKLRDSGSHGFLLPPKYIEPVGREVFAGFKYFCYFILSDERQHSN
ncbi:putative metallocarboxypeptidase ECM14 [Spathaspora sp. JA1]|nr:putative metallocarboxypeptidase ECM14 [Spathaspora sp. JA1]